MARDPIKRARSREADRVRKRAKRELANIRKRYEQTGDFQERRRLRESMRSLESDIAKSYANPSATLKAHRTMGVKSPVSESALVAAARGVGSKAGEGMAAAALGRLGSRERKTMRDLMGGIDFRREMRVAGRGGVSVLGEHGDIKVAAFWRVTQNMWETVDPQYREKAVLEGLGVDTLRQAYAKVMSRKDVRRVVSRLMAEEDSGHVIESTTDMAEAYYSAERPGSKRDQYPRAIFAMLPVIEAVKAYGA